MSAKGEDVTRFSSVDQTSNPLFLIERADTTVARLRGRWLRRAGWVLWTSGVALLLLEMLRIISTALSANRSPLHTLWRSVSLDCCLVGALIIVGSILISIGREPAASH